MTSPSTAIRLRTEFLVNPLGLDEPRPRFFWWVQDSRSGARQTAWRIRCASSQELLGKDAPDIWDSGRVASNTQAHVEYGGRPLASRQRVYWDVRLWDADGLAGAVSAPAFFEMGLPRPDDWQAGWIRGGMLGTGAHRPPVPLLRQSFRVKGTVRQARLYITALGLHQASVNGARVSDDWFRPGWTDYRKRLQYQVYDVTAQIRAGDNAVGVLLGDGWYCGRIAHYERGLNYGDRPALLAQLELELADGSRQVVASGPDWQWTTGPILGSDLIDGEDYDARREIAGWDAPGTPAGDWRPVEVFTPANIGPLAATPNLPVRVVAELPAVAEPRKLMLSWGRVGYIYDLGQNISGVVRLRVKGPAGATLRLRYAEMLQADGRLYTDNLRSARATDHYTLRGDPRGETWTPSFTFHGFRFVELSVCESWLKGASPLQTPSRETVTGLALVSELPGTGSFSCDHELLNRLQGNIVWGQRGNFLDIPTDCPQRDERLGWTGDAQVFAATAAFNTDAAAFFTKWCRDLDDAQEPGGEIPHVAPNVLDHCDAGPGWSDARVVVPWEMYLAYADRRILERHYPSMKKWLEYQQGSSRNGLRCGAWHEGHRGFGDWLALDIEGRPATSKMLIGTAYFARSCQLAAEIAKLLGQDADAKLFTAWRNAAVAAFNREFVTPSGTLSEPTQTAYLMALAWDLLPETQRAAAFDRLLAIFEEKKWHLSTGFLGTPLICPVLTRFGRPDLAYRVLLQTTYPGWLFPVVNGATTMWERWNSWTPDKGFGDVGMNSFNHYAYGAIGKWLYGNLGGIEAAAPGYKHALIAPKPGGGIRQAAAALDTLHGRIETSWILADGKFTLRAGIPANATATVRLPDGAAHEVAAGTHEFSCRLPD